MKRRHKVIGMTVLYIMLVVLTGCGKSTENTLQKEVVEVEQEPVATPEPTATPVPTPTPFPEYDINLMMVGDNLMHMGIVTTGKQADGSYNYDFLFEGIEEFLAEAEVKMINQETILGGESAWFFRLPPF